MENKELFNKWEIIEYFGRLSEYDHEILVTNGTEERYAIFSCGEIVFENEN